MTHPSRLALAAVNTAARAANVALDLAFAPATVRRLRVENAELVRDIARLEDLARNLTADLRAAESATDDPWFCYLDRIADPTMTAEQRENEHEAYYLAAALADAKDVDDVLYVMGGEEG